MHWPAHTHLAVSWSQSQRAGTKADRMLSEVVVTLPPMIADIDAGAGGIDLVSQSESRATSAITRLDALAPSRALGALGHMLIRLESVASSKIEHLDASVADYARAIAGSRANGSATAMVAASVAIHDMIDRVEAGTRLTREMLLTAHAALLGDDPHESAFAGRVRTMQNWVGGSDYSPRDALYIPPPPETVDDYLDDLLDFANRDDLPPLTQAAIAHAQFESIHPFTDGNGRIGRALIHAVLRRRDVARHVVVPLASALVADQSGYFSMLTRYRAGDVVPIVDGIARAAEIAAETCLSLPSRLAELPLEWRSASDARLGSAADRLLDLLPARPVVTTATVEEMLGVSYTAASRALTTLVDAGILTPLDERKRDRAFVSTEVMGELESIERLVRQLASLKG